jgi:two-component system KDP operon response regulator KdpE
MMEVLIIDDEEQDRYLVKQRLRNLPLLVREATEELKRRAACKHKPDVILLDLGMADLSGFEVLES